MKNPAVLFYTSDFMTGTLFLTNEEVGAYIRLLCMQHQKGHLTENEVLQICKNNETFSSIKNYFKVDKKGLYFNKRMELEIEKRTKYSESRARNRTKKEITYEEDMNNICNTYEKHMENENVNENIYINNTNNNLFEYIEKEFGRTFSPAELEVISQWEDNELTRYAIKETVLARANSLKYTQSILESYKTKGLKTLSDIEADKKKYKETKKERNNGYKTQLEKTREAIEKFRNEHRTSN